MNALVIAISLVISAVVAQNLPPFLNGAPQNVVDEFNQVLAASGGRTDSQNEQEIESWVSRQSPQIQTSFAQFKQQILSAKQQGQTQHQAAIANLSPEAQKIDMQLAAIAEHPELPGSSKQAQIQQILNSVPENIKQELKQAFQGGRK